MNKREITIRNDERLQVVAEALSLPARRDIIKLLSKGSFSITGIARSLNMPTSNVIFNLKVLQKAGLVSITENKLSRGKEKIVSRQIDHLHIDLMEHLGAEYKSINYAIPIGMYSDCKIIAPCGIIDESKEISNYDMPEAFYNPRRMNAQLLWFSDGWLEYRIPNDVFKNGKEIKAINFAMELCSEAPNYKNDWESDITFWINDIEVCTYCSPGDFGGRRGMLNPDWWPDANTQFGALVSVAMHDNTVILNQRSYKGLKFEKLNLEKGDYISFKIGFKEDCAKKRGINLFGEKYGDYAQNINFNIQYKENS